jgi:hypothetical protein
MLGAAKIGEASEPGEYDEGMLALLQLIWGGGFLSPSAGPFEGGEAAVWTSGALTMNYFDFWNREYRFLHLFYESLLAYA